MKVLIAAGGTGGHIFPALAVAQMLDKKSNVDIIWLGSYFGMEGAILSKYPYLLYQVTSVGLRGKKLSALLKAPFLLSWAFIKTIYIFFKIKPDIVLAMGGFSAGVSGVVAKLFTIPLFIHEQNAVAGFTNRILSKIATRTYQAFDDSFADKKINAITSGNPIAFKPQKKPSKKNKLTEKQPQINNVLVLGGSLGAKAINKIIPQLNTTLNLYHQTGRTHVETVKDAYRLSSNLENAKRAKIVAFIDDMPSAYAWADIVICRAGAMTISELMLCGSVSILIPFPHAIDNHQSANAQILTKADAAILLPESKLNPKNLDNILINLADKTRIQMSKNTRRLAKPDAVKIIVDDLLSFEKEK